MATKFVGVEKQAEILKDQGNLYFKKERLGAAIEAYTEAITLRPNVATYWTNRALCHKRRNEWDRVEADCRKALELDKSSLKARYMLGLALLQNNQYGEAIKQLEKALELGRGCEQGNEVEAIWQEVAKARYTEWEQAAKPRLQKQDALRKFCEQALQETFNNDLVKLSRGKGAQYSDGCFPSDDSEAVLKGVDGTCIAPIEIQDTEEEIDDQTTRAPIKISKLRNSYIEQKQILAEVFDKAAQCDKPSEVPEYLCCKITMDIFRDPVITPSGVTYERAVILDHLQKVGKFDPLTRASLQPEQLVRNLAIKEAVQAYLADHGWAYKMN